LDHASAGSRRKQERSRFSPWRPPRTKGNARMMCRAVPLAAALLVALTFRSPAAEEAPRIPVLVPLTGFLALEGTSQRNGAVLALDEAPEGSVVYEVEDTGTSPEVAVNALERAL